jgi:excisionase family DNA binding protein
MTEPANHSDSLLLWNARKAAKALGISDRTLWTMTKDGAIPHVPVGYRVLYDPEDLKAWIKRQKRNGGSNSNSDS